MEFTGEVKRIKLIGTRGSVAQNTSGYGIRVVEAGDIGSWIEKEGESVS